MLKLKMAALTRCSAELQKMQCAAETSSNKPVAPANGRR